MSSESLGRRVTMTKLAVTKFNNLGTAFTFYLRKIVTHDLYPTKGWRLVGKFTEQIMQTPWRDLPEFDRVFIPSPHRTPRQNFLLGPSDAGRLMRGRDPITIVITERMLMRHGWYRRQLRKQGISMRDVGKNSVMLTAAGIPPEKMGARL